jgi:hypothetical protein
LVIDSDRTPLTESIYNAFENYHRIRMQPIEHPIPHFFQPTNHSCGQTAIAMLLSHFGRSDSPESVMESVPVLSVGNIAEWGTLAPSLAAWVAKQEFTVDMYTSDFQLLDLSWSNLDMPALRARLVAAKEVRVVQSLGAEVSKMFLQTYIDLIDAGGQIHIRPYIPSALLNELLVEAPIFANLNTNVLYNRGRQSETGLRKSISDDLKGGLDTHFVVIYGTDGNSSYSIADPWEPPGRHHVDKERLLAAIGAGQIQCENAIFQARLIEPAR